MQAGFMNLFYTPLPLAFRMQIAMPARFVPSYFSFFVLNSRTMQHIATKCGASRAYLSLFCFLYDYIMVFLMSNWLRFYPISSVRK